MVERAGRVVFGVVHVENLVIGMVAKLLERVAVAVVEMGQDFNRFGLVIHGEGPPGFCYAGSGERTGLRRRVGSGCFRLGSLETLLRESLRGRGQPVVRIVRSCWSGL